LAVVTTLTLASGARAHPGSTLTGYVSTVSAVVPNVLGVNALVLGGDDRLRISNYSGKTVVVLGYEGEPYLRFDSKGVWANTLSPAAHLNRFRRPVPHIALYAMGIYWLGQLGIAIAASASF